MQKVTTVTVEDLKELNSADLRKAATSLGIKNSKKYAKDDLLKLCIKEVSKSEKVVTKKEPVKATASETIDTPRTEIPQNTEQIIPEVVEEVDVTKFASSLEKDGAKFYQYYPYKKKFEGKTLTVFRKKNAVGKGSTSWIEDSEGNKVFESKSWDASYFKAIKLRNEQYTDCKVVVFFDSKIPVPGSYGKTY